MIAAACRDGHISVSSPSQVTSRFLQVQASQLTSHLFQSQVKSRLISYQVTSHSVQAEIMSQAFLPIRSEVANFSSCYKQSAVNLSLPPICILNLMEDKIKNAKMH